MIDHPRLGAGAPSGGAGLGDAVDLIARQIWAVRCQKCYWRGGRGGKASAIGGNFFADFNAVATFARRYKSNADLYAEMHEYMGFVPKHVSLDAGMKNYWAGDGRSDDDDENDADFTADKGGGVDIDWFIAALPELESFIAALPEPQKKPVSMLVQLDLEAQCLYAAHRREVRALDRKHEQLNAPIFAERARIVAGEAPPSSGGTAGEGIPGFWLEAMKNSRRVRECITERDEPALQHLVDVIATTLPEIPPETPPTAMGEGGSKAGAGTWAFRLEFVFRPNEFFTNTRLVKTYWLSDTPEVEVVRSEGCAIEWRDGKCLTMRTVCKKRRNRAGRGLRTVLRTERCDSFFHFFSPPQPPQPGERPDGEVDSDERERYEERLEEDGRSGPRPPPLPCAVL
jgi:hypothetical protein